jgi:hypothetical protein
MAVLTCQYCSHRGEPVGARCANCGAPLDPAPVAGEPSTAADPTAALPAEWFPGGATGTHSRRQWLVAALAIAAVLVLVLLLASRCGAHRDGPALAGTDAGAGGTLAYLPAQLRAVASCAPDDTNPGGDRCVVPAESPLLADDIAGGRDLTFSVAVDPPLALTQTVARWREEGGAIVEDDATFVAVGPAATVRYADTQTGVRIETGALRGNSAATTFLARAGLRGR